MRKNPLAVAALAFFLIFLATGAFGAPPKPSQSNQVTAAPPVSGAMSPLRPDLIVQTISVTGTHPDPSGGTRVDVQYTIANTTPYDSWKFPTPAGTKYWHDTPALYQQMYSWLDMRELPNGAFPVLLGADCPIMLGANAVWTCNGGVVVPHGKKVQIRATVDSLNYINESSESNNSKTVDWPAAALAQPVHK